MAHPLEKGSARGDYGRYLGLPATEDPGVLRRQILRGLPYRAFLDLREAMELSAAELGELVQIKPRTLARRRSEGRLRTAESDRLARAARLLGLAVELCEGDLRAARRWLATPSRALAGESPLALGRTEIGAREVEELVGRLEYGVAT